MNRHEKRAAAKRGRAERDVRRRIEEVLDVAEAYVQRAGPPPCEGMIIQAGPAPSGVARARADAIVTVGGVSLSFFRRSSLAGIPARDHLSVAIEASDHHPHRVITIAGIGAICCWRSSRWMAGTGEPVYTSPAPSSSWPAALSAPAIAHQGPLSPGGLA